MIRSIGSIEARLEKLQLAVGRIESRLDGNRYSEFQVFSQWGEDGIIARILSKVAIEREIFVEFGVETYAEANTRFLLLTRNWRGLVMDGDAENVRRIRDSDLYWRHELDAHAAFITRENINQLLGEYGISGDIGLLSVDIDGNDYWVWQAIESISPRIVIVEYNSLFGPERAVTVPYDAAFLRSKKHHSNLYYGASAAALARLGETKGYSLVTGNEAGNNLFFVRKDLLGDMRPMPVAAAYRRSRFRETRSEAGELTFVDFAQRARVIAHLPVVDLDSGREVSLKSLAIQ